jgi:hypothetical protein
MSRFFIVISSTAHDRPPGESAGQNHHSKKEDRIRPQRHVTIELQCLGILLDDLLRAASSLFALLLWLQSK